MALPGSEEQVQSPLSRAENSPKELAPPSWVLAEEQTPGNSPLARAEERGEQRAEVMKFREERGYTKG